MEAGAVRHSLFGCSQVPENQQMFFEKAQFIEQSLEMFFQIGHVIEIFDQVK